eukprot:1688315-Prorocentrum_lima.AAC.1
MSTTEQSEMPLTGGRGAQAAARGRAGKQRAPAEGRGTGERPRVGFRQLCRADDGKKCQCTL